MELVAKEAICCWNGAVPNPSVPPHCAQHPSPEYVLKKQTRKLQNELSQKKLGPVDLPTKFFDPLTK